MQEDNKVAVPGEEKSVVIATPCYGETVTSGYMMSVLGATVCNTNGNSSFTLMHIGDDALLPRVRSRLLTGFLSNPAYTHILFVDGDISFEASAPAKLLESGKDFVGGMYPLRDRYWDQETVNNIQNGEKPETASLRYVGETQAFRESSASDHLVRVPYLGTGFMMVSRKAIEQMVKSYPQLEYDRIDAVNSGEGQKHYALFDMMIDPDTKTYLSEDYSFCRRWRDIGGEIWADTSIILKHTGPSAFVGNPMLRLGSENKKRRAT